MAFHYTFSQKGAVGELEPRMARSGGQRMAGQGASSGMQTCEESASWPRNSRIGGSNCAVLRKRAVVGSTLARPRWTVKVKPVREKTLRMAQLKTCAPCREHIGGWPTSRTTRTNCFQPIATAFSEQRATSTSACWTPSQAGTDSILAAIHRWPSQLHARRPAPADGPIAWPSVAPAGQTRPATPAAC